MKAEGCRGKAVTVYNRKEGIEQTFCSIRETARTLDVSESQIGRAVRTGQWVFAKGMNVRVRTA